jgi:hypothetical protein
MLMRSKTLLILLAAACGPRVRPAGPGDEPSGGTHGPLRADSHRGGGPPIALGEMCPDRAAGRPGVSVVLLGRGLSWSDDPDEITDVVTRGETPRFAVLSWSGKRAGVFTVAGAADGEGALPIAVGGYAGAAACEDEATRAECETTIKACAMALGGVGTDADDLPEITMGGACAIDGRLVLDVDGDGNDEQFNAADFLDPLRAPTEEVVGTPAERRECARRFAMANVLPSTQPKHFRGMDLLGVADLDGDARHELILQVRYNDKRTWVVYSPSQVATRLELIAEVEPWGE